MPAIVTKMSNRRSGSYNHFTPITVDYEDMFTEDGKALPRDIKKDINKFQLEGYAKKYFKTRKKGLFKKEVPIKEMLTFQRVSTLKISITKHKRVFPSETTHRVATQVT